MPPLPHRRARTARSLAVTLTAAALLVASCSGDDDGEATPDPTTTVTPQAGATTTAPEAGVTAEGISDERCQANRDAGTITYISSFDFAASPAIVDVVVADDAGYFERLCLDVELRSGFSTSNYPLVAGDRAQFSSAGSYTEMVRNNVNGADLVLAVNYGKTAIEGLVVRAGAGVSTLADLRGKVIGVKGAVPPSIVAMLGAAGVHPGDWQEVQLDGFDPVVHMQTNIDALPVYKSNEPRRLEQAGVDFTMFDPLDEGIPGSFGILYTNRSFLDAHPTAAQDFVRAAMAGYADAAADPDAAVAASVARIDAAGNLNGLSAVSETFRWTQESTLVSETTPTGEVPGQVDPDLLTAEVEAMVEAGVLAAVPDDLDRTYDVSLAAGVVADGQVVMPPA